LPDAPDPNRIALGARLREAREYLGLSQDEAAKAVGIARSAVSLIESGQRTLDALELQKFAQAYGRTTEFFLGEVRSIVADPATEHLARSWGSLTEQDRQELAQFAEFLRARKKLSGE
jgi:transcriptional regulator with XRE-family HTH domain